VQALPFVYAWWSERLTHSITEDAFVEAHMELQVDAFAEPFRGRVVWVNKSTGAQFALLPRNVVSGEFTRVVQRVPVRIAIEKDERWPRLRSGLSVRAVIAHGEGDPRWAEEAAREMADLERRYNRAKE
jgi:membrane fusion protein (multidrug efflux system)